MSLQVSERRMLARDLPRLEFSYDPIEDVCLRPIKAVGVRPQDWMARDFRMQNWRHDPRMHVCRRIFGDEPDSRILACVQAAGLPPDQMVNGRARKLEAEAIGILNVDWMFKTRIVSLMEADPYSDDKLLKELYACPPVGVCFKRTTEIVAEETGCRIASRPVALQGGDPNLQPCGHTALCPNCLTRKVIELYDQILARLSDDAYLVLASECPGYVEPQLRNDVQAWVDECGEVLSPDWLEYDPLGGLGAVQILPRRKGRVDDWDEPGFEVRGAVLGQVDPACIDVSTRRFGTPVRATPANVRRLLIGARNGNRFEPGLFVMPCFPLIHSRLPYDNGWMPYFEQFAAISEAVTQVPLFKWQGGWDRRQNALRLAREDRQHAAGERLQAALPQARRVWLQLWEQRGKPPGRPRFSKALAESGYPHRGRIVAKLIKVLKSETTASLADASPADTPEQSDTVSA